MAKKVRYIMTRLQIKTNYMIISMHMEVKQLESTGTTWVVAETIANNRA